MAESQQPNLSALVYGSDGNAYDRNNLLSFRNRWTSNKKALILDGLKKRMITEEDLKRVYNIDELELLEWTKAYATNRQALSVIKGHDIRRRLAGEE